MTHGTGVTEEQVAEWESVARRALAECTPTNLGWSIPTTHPAVVEFTAYSLPDVLSLLADWRRMREALGDAEKRRDIAEHKAAILSRQVDRYLPCPDHRDKHNGTCYMCAAEKAREASHVA